MTDRIIVAGSGVGGLITAALLAKNGFNVTLYSLGTPEALGYDWTDSLSVELLEQIIGTKIPQKDIFYDDIVAFYTPSERMEVSSAANGPRTTTKMERRVFEQYIYRFATESGVEFHWDTKVVAPIFDGDKVTGIRTDNGDVLGNLVIDACGVNSPLRSNMPPSTMIENAPSYGEVFHVYRAMYERKILGEKPLCPLEIYLLHLGAQGISWYCTRDAEIDILIGRFAPIKVQDVNAVITAFGGKHPEFVNRIVRGAKECQIPVRRPLNKFVCNSYAAIGDSAYMTLPMNGSGINFTMKAAQILANVILNAQGDYSTEKLWAYQHEYYLKYGANLAGVEAIKNTLLGMNPNHVDFLFENRIITQKEMDSEEELKLSFKEIVGKAVRGIKNLPALLALVKGLAANGNLSKHFAALPSVYTDDAFRIWNDKANRLVVRVKEN